MCPDQHFQCACASDAHMRIHLYAHAHTPIEGVRMQTCAYRDSCKHPNGHAR